MSNYLNCVVTQKLIRVKIDPAGSLLVAIIDPAGSLLAAKSDPPLQKVIRVPIQVCFDNYIIYIQILAIC